MTTYNTGNPIGSTDARDRLDNSENMDILENSTTLNAHADRLGTMRKTRKGMELEHDNQMQSFERDFDNRLAGMAFARVGTFTAGATLTDMRQTLLWELSQGGDGREYGWTGSFLPTGKVVAAGSSPSPVSAGNWVDRTEDRLRSDLNSDDANLGTKIIKHIPSGASASPVTAQKAIRDAHDLANDEKRLYALRRWFNQLGYVDRTTCDILVIGDSIFEGYNMTALLGSVLTSDLPMRKLAKKLQTKFNQNGITAGKGYVPVKLALGTTATDYPVTLSGGTFSGNSVGLGARSYLINTSSNITYTFSTVTANARVRIYYNKNTVSGSFRWTLDGSATAVVSATGTDADFSRVDITITTPGNHNLVITGESGVVLIDGFFHEDGDKSQGIRMWEGCHAGAASSLFTSTSVATALAQQVSAINPTLVIIELGANDFTGINPPNSVATFKSNLISIINATRQASTVNASVVLVGTWELGVTITPVDTWNNYVQAIKEIADSDDGIVFFDAAKYIRRYGSAITSPFNLLSDTAHLSLSGSGVLTEALLNFLTP